VFENYIMKTNLDKPLEGILRPPLEWYSAGTALLLAAILKIFPEYFLIPDNMFNWVCLGLVAFAGWRFWQGLQIVRYHRRLKAMPRYEMTSHELPVKTNTLFLGKGFLWGPIHTQRLRDLDLAYNREYTATNSEESGYPHLHGISMKEQDIFMRLRDRGQHILVLGTTGVGKTRFAEILIGQDIRRGDVVIVLDPKGDQALLHRIQEDAKIANRVKDFRMIHLGFPKESCRYNPIGFFTKITQVATRIANALPSTGEAAAFKEFSWKYVNLVTRGLVYLQLTPTYRFVNFYLTKLDQLFIRVFGESLKENPILQDQYTKALIKATRQAEKDQQVLKPSKVMLTVAEMYVESQGKNPAQLANEKIQLLNDLISACRLDRSYYDKITASIGPLLEKLTTGEIADLFSPNLEDKNDQRPILDWMSVIREKQIVYVGMDALTDQVISSVIGNALLSDLVATAGHLYKFPLDKNKIPAIHLHSDEFNEVIGDEFIPLLNKARGAGFDVTAYTQTWSDVEARLNSKAKAGQVAGNLGTVIMFRCKEAKTVDMLLEQLPKVPIARVVPASSSSDNPHGVDGTYFNSSNEDRLSYENVPMVSQNDVLNLPKGQAFALLEGGKLYKLRIPLPK
jgi:conjugative coupling factor TraD (SXT/TOL subfamily)